MSGLGLMLDLPDQAVERIAEIVERRVAERLADLVSPWMTVPQVADYMSAPTSRIYKLTSTDELPHHKEGGRLLFHRDEVDAYIRGEAVARRRQGN